MIEWKAGKELLLDQAEFLYGIQDATALINELIPLLEAQTSSHEPQALSEKDTLLITYGDMLGPTDRDASGLMKLKKFLARWNKDYFSYIHILPFHPYTSDDGFSVVDYREVDSRLGSWADIEAIGATWKLAIDFVINHGSVSSPWFKAFLEKEAPYEDWYITRSKDYDWASVVRPRTHPLLTPFRRTDNSEVWVWTTFSADQADYDFSKPKVLLEFIRIFLEFARRGAKILRLDAIAYLWKEDGTSCLHHPKTHGVVKLLRTLVDLLGLDLLLLTETNVPHEQNLSYYGQGDEAHMVYNFALPPLVLHTALSGDGEPLRRWAAALPESGKGPVFLNFLASHDGVGLTPALGLIDTAAFEVTLEIAKKRGALISYKTSPGGNIPYELNCSYLSIIAPPELGSPSLRARAFLSCHGVLLSLAGLPAVYFHSWIGSENWIGGLKTLGYNRAINREKPDMAAVEAELNRSESLRSAVYSGFAKLLNFRGAEAAFAPRVTQKVLPAPKALFALLRGPDPSGRHVLCLENLGAEGISFKLETDKQVPMEAIRGAEDLELDPWETRWIAFGGNRPSVILRL